MSPQSVSRLKKWWHYDVLYFRLLPVLPEGVGTSLYAASRHWLYGPGAGSEDLRELLDRS